MPILSPIAPALAARLVGAAGLDRAAALQAPWRKANFNPNQPRVPRGNPDGGQWTQVGVPEDEVLVAQNAPPLPEQILNRHILSEHVAKTDEELIARIAGEQFPGLFVHWGMYRNGTFTSTESARDFILRTLKANPDEVLLVSTGTETEARLLTLRFGYPTGREAIFDWETSSVRIRTTFEVGVVIIYDPTKPSGYRIVTAYPRNYNPYIGR